MLKQTFYIYGNIDFGANTAAAKRMMYYAKALSDNENRVYLVSCCSDSLSHENFAETIPNVYLQKDKHLVKKPFSIFFFLKRFAKFSQKSKENSSFILYPQAYFFLELFSVFYLIFYKKKPVYYELNEVKRFSSIFHERQSIRRPKYAIKTVVFKTKFIIMDYLMRYYEGLLCISTNIEEYGKKYNSNTLRIPILTDSNFTFQKSNKIYSKRDLFNVGFSGSIVPSKENLFEFTAVIKALQDQGYNLAFNLCGIVTKENYDTLILQSGLKNIKYYGNLDEKELNNFLEQQNLLVVPRGFTLQNNFGFSTKLSDYLNHRKIILITDISDNAMYIQNGINGFIVPPNEPDKMQDQLLYIMNNFLKLEKSITENAYIASKQNFDYRLYRKSLRSFLAPVGQK